MTDQVKVEDLEANFVAGDRVFPLSPLTLGTLRKRKLLNAIQRSSQIKKGEMPDEDAIEAMLSIVFASIELGTPTIDRVTFDAAVDALGFTTGLKRILLAFKEVMLLSNFDESGKLSLGGEGAQGEASQGEANGPQSST